MSKITFIRLFLLCFLFLNAFVLKAQTASPEKKLRHVVLFKFKDTSKPEDIKKVEDAFRALPRKLSIVKDFEWGTNSSPENLNQGLTHCFLVTFSSDKDRDTYLTHPDHQAFVEVLKPHLDKVTVIDYWTK
jgi:hypothetical protein